MRLVDADLLGLTDMEIIMCDGDYKEALKMLIDKIEHAPTIEPERKTGHWIKCGDRVKCDQCALTNKYSKPFCPNCGTKMTKEGEKE